MHNFAKELGKHLFSQTEKIKELLAEVERLRPIVEFFTDWHGEEGLPELKTEAKACRDRTEELSKLVCQQSAEIERLRTENERAWEFIHTIERFVAPGTTHERWRYMPLERIRELAREKGILPPEQE